MDQNLFNALVLHKSLSSAIVFYKLTQHYRVLH